MKLKKFLVTCAASFLLLTSCSTGGIVSGSDNPFLSGNTPTSNPFLPGGNTSESQENISTPQGTSAGETISSFNYIPKITLTSASSYSKETINNVISYFVVRLENYPKAKKLGEKLIELFVYLGVDEANFSVLFDEAVKAIDEVSYSYNYSENYYNSLLKTITILDNLEISKIESCKPLLFEFLDLVYKYFSIVTPSYSSGSRFPFSQVEIDKLSKIVDASGNQKAKEYVNYMKEEIEAFDNNARVLPTSFSSYARYIKQVYEFFDFKDLTSIKLFKDSLQIVYLYFDTLSNLDVTKAMPSSQWDGLGYRRAYDKGFTLVTSYEKVFSYLIEQIPTFDNVIHELEVHKEDFASLFSTILNILKQYDVSSNTWLGIISTMLQEGSIDAVISGYNLIKSIVKDLDKEGIKKLAKLYCMQFYADKETDIVGSPLYEDFNALLKEEFNYAYEKYKALPAQDKTNLDALFEVILKGKLSDYIESFKTDLDNGKKVHIRSILAGGSKTEKSSSNSYYLFVRKEYFALNSEFNPNDFILDYDGYRYELTNDELDTSKVFYEIVNWDTSKVGIFDGTLLCRIPNGESLEVNFTYAVRRDFNVYSYFNTPLAPEGEIAPHIYLKDTTTTNSELDFSTVGEKMLFEETGTNSAYLDFYIVTDLDDLEVFNLYNTAIFVYLDSYERDYCIGGQSLGYCIHSKQFDYYSDIRLGIGRETLENSATHFDYCGLNLEVNYRHFKKSDAIVTNDSYILMGREGSFLRTSSRYYILFNHNTYLIPEESKVTTPITINGNMASFEYNGETYELLYYPIPAPVSE